MRSTPGARACAACRNCASSTSYHDEPLYIDALARSVQRHWQDHGRPDQLVMSFHGIPERNIRLGDPYQAQCLATARLLAERLQLTPAQYRVTFQSRFGRAKWLEPYTEPTLRELGAAGVARVDVMCPGFPADCLETLEEIAMEGREAFLQAGRQGLPLHPLPERQHAPGSRRWPAIAERHLGGWPTRAPEPRATQNRPR